MSIPRGYEPVAKLDTNVMASRQALCKMGFPSSQIDKVDAVAKARKHFEKSSKELAKLSKKGKGEYDKGHSASPEYPICDICGNPTVISGVKLTSPEQETSIPPVWAPFALSRFGSASHSDYRAYVLIPPGIVIDYQSHKVYVVCGNCRVVLGLRTTESGILIHNETKGTGYGFVDLDRVERLIQTYKAHKSSGYGIDCLIDFDAAVHIDKL
jgi:hypothetical protein